MNKKYYVVWNGRSKGIFDTWEECNTQIKGFSCAQYKSFPTKKDAEEAWLNGKNSKNNNTQNIITPSIAIDAACSGNPGNMEYQGVDVETGKTLFHQGPYPQGTNNIGEFLALVHGLAYLKQKSSNIPIYSDSRTAMGWIEKKHCGTKLTPTNQNKILFELISRAEQWLKTNSYNNSVLKWNTKSWGEIPADFGRK